MFRRIEDQCISRVEEQNNQHNYRTHTLSLQEIIPPLISSISNGINSGGSLIQFLRKD